MKVGESVEIEQGLAGDHILKVNHLKSKDARQKWEKEFVNTYVQPILSSLDEHLDEARRLFTEDSKGKQARKSSMHKIIQHGHT